MINSTLNNWAMRHNISAEAIQELIALSLPVNQPTDITTEANIQINARLEASRNGAVLWRNNTGVAYDQRGVPVRFGLSNESPQMNKNVKSSDLIGIRPIRITSEMIGCNIGQFVAIECKKPGWVYRGNDREQAQQNFINIVNTMGGFGKFLSSEGVFNYD